MVCRGVRGATTVSSDDQDLILQAARELLALMVRINEIDAEDVASAIFTTTSDIHAVFPALAARQLGWMDVPLLCGYEMDVDGALPFCLRILLHWNTEKKQSQIQHIYLRDATSLRPDQTLALSDQDMAELHLWMNEHFDAV